MPFNIFKKQSKQTCVVGLDGVPYTLISKLAETGVMPRFREILAQGRMVPMHVTLPEISAVSWSSFMTGKNPGEHGIFGFTDLKPDGKSLRFPSYRDLKAKTIWDRLGKKGGKSIVINQPSTYPALPIPGVLISGFVAIDLERSVTPPRYYAMLKDIGYEVDADTEKCKDSPPALLESLNSLLDKRQKVLDFLWKDIDWNFMEVIVTGTDRLHHFLWDAIEDDAHEHHEGFLNYYRNVDTFVGYVYDKFQRDHEGGHFFMLSDHGFCGTKNEVYVNTPLVQEGFLSLEKPDARSPNAITDDSKAFALDPARIYIRRKGRFPNGCVDPADVAPIKKDLTALFEPLSKNGTQIVRRVFDAEEVYTGPYAERGPDLLIVPNNGYDMKGRLGHTDIIGERKLQGMHTWDNAFFFTLQKNMLPDASLQKDNGEIHLLEASRIIAKSLDVE
jgi:predicted AlkP superfamily phosphohydrolase/phosphomutase